MEGSILRSPSISAISLFGTARLRLTSWETLLLGRSPETGNSDQVRTRTRDPARAPQTTHPRAYSGTRDSRPRVTLSRRETRRRRAIRERERRPERACRTGTLSRERIPGGSKIQQLSTLSPLSVGRQGVEKRQRRSPTRATQPKTLTCRNGAPSQRTTPSSQTLPRRVRTPKPAIFPATHLAWD